MKKTRLLRKLLKAESILLAPGVYNGLSAKIVEKAGFKVVYISGGAISRSMGFPDLGLVTMTEMLSRVREIVNAVNIPVIADMDTGYGGVINVWRSVREFENAGVAGFHLEDQVFPKRCGHYSHKQVISAEEMVEKIKAAQDARQDPDLLIIARTDARAVYGLKEAIDRARIYAEAGADVIFVEAPQSKEELIEIARSVSAPLLVNIFKGGKTPVVSLSELKEWGYKIVIVPSDLQRAAIKAMQTVAKFLLEKGTCHDRWEDMVSFRERDELVGLPFYEKLMEKFRSFAKR